MSASPPTEFVQRREPLLCANSVLTQRSRAPLFDLTSSAGGEQRWSYVEAERSGGLEVDQLKRCALRH
jgi:hypothetical protein